MLDTVYACSMNSMPAIENNNSTHFSCNELFTLRANNFSSTLIFFSFLYFHKLYGNSILKHLTIKWAIQLTSTEVSCFFTSNILFYFGKQSERLKKINSNTKIISFIKQRENIRKKRIGKIWSQSGLQIHYKHNKFGAKFKNNICTPWQTLQIMCKLPV